MCPPLGQASKPLASLLLQSGNQLLGLKGQAPLGCHRFVLTLQLYGLGTVSIGTTKLIEE